MMKLNHVLPLFVHTEAADATILAKRKLFARDKNVEPLTGQFTDKLTHGQSSCTLINLWTSQLANSEFKKTQF